MPWLTVVALIAGVVTVAGLAINRASTDSRGPQAFACDRGFRAEDWAHQRVSTGRAVASCGWLNGMTETAVRRLLGPPDGVLGRLSWSLGPPVPDTYAQNWNLGLRSTNGRIRQAYVELVSD